MPIFDDKDAELLAKRIEARNRINGCIVGDYVKFKDGVIRRISYIWNDGSIQTSDSKSLAGFSGSYHLLQDGNASYSGGLYRGVPKDSFELTNEKRMGGFWFFHHDYPMAHNSVDVSIPCNVWQCNLDSAKF